MHLFSETSLHSDGAGWLLLPMFHTRAFSGLETLPEVIQLISAKAGVLTVHRQLLAGPTCFFSFLTFSGDDSKERKNAVHPVVHRDVVKKQEH